MRPATSSDFPRKRSKPSRTNSGTADRHRTANRRTAPTNCRAAAGGENTEAVRSALPSAGLGGGARCGEIHPTLAAGLREGAMPRVEVVEGDVLNVDLETLGLPAGTRVAGNLPYNI